MFLNEISSNTLNYLKCILCVGVVFIHARFYPDLSVVGVNEFEGYKFYNALDCYFNANFLNSTCVPLFFVISGYLFFLNIPELFGWKVYLTKLKSRIGSLLIPYLICNMLFVLFNNTISLLHGTPFNPWDCFSSFWSIKGGLPIMAQTWYIRDLMVMCLLTPIIWFAIRFGKVFLLIALCGCWFTEWWYNIPGIDIRSAMFFSIGSYIGIHGIDLLEMVRPRKLWFVYCIIFAILFALYIIYDLEWIHKLSIIASFPVWICLANFISSMTYVRCSNTFVAGTFFVFLYHFPLAHRVSAYFTKIFGINEPVIIFAYISGAITTTIMLLIVFYMGKKFMPKYFKVIVGGR